MSYKIGTKDKPMVLKTPPLTSEYTMHVDKKKAKIYWCVQLVKLFYTITWTALMACTRC